MIVSQWILYSALSRYKISGTIPKERGVGISCVCVYVYVVLGFELVLATHALYHLNHTLPTLVDILAREQRNTFLLPHIPCFKV
jgi:hypothetical protein